MTALIRRGLAAIAMLLLCATFAVAQEQSDIDYKEWLSTVEKADTLIDGGVATVKEYEDLRREIAGWRDSFLQAESTNAAGSTRFSRSLRRWGRPRPRARARPRTLRSAARI